MARNSLLIFTTFCIIGYIFAGKSFLNIFVVVLCSSFMYVFVNEKTIIALKLVSVIVCLGITWFRRFIIGNETLLYNQVHMIIIPLPLLIFTGSYRITLFTFIYAFFFFRYNASEMKQEFDLDPDASDRTLSYLLDNFSPLYLVVWVFLTLVIYQKEVLISQLWAKQKEKEELLLKIQKKNQELEEIHKSKTKLLLGLSHEFRNPINAALGNLELANEKIPDPMIQKFLTNCKVSIEMLFHLVSNLLDSTKLEAGILELNPLRKDSKAMFYKVWDIVKNLLDKQNLVGEFYIHKKIPPMLKIDSHFTIQILLNLALNAIKYTQEGAVMIVVSWLDDTSVSEVMLQPSNSFYTRFCGISAQNQTSRLSPVRHRHSSNDQPVQNSKPNESSEIDGIPSEPSILADAMLKKSRLVHQHSMGSIEMFQQIVKNYEKLTNTQEINGPVTQRQEPVTGKKKGFLKLEVYDSGIGIDLGVSNDDIFKKVVPGKTRSGDRLSLGMGLWLTKSLCEAMGGQVKAFSEKDKGSQFIAAIPVESLQVLEVEEDVQVGHRMKMKSFPVKLNALVVDDDKYNREINSIFLAKAGVVVKAEAVNGEEAVEIFKSKPANYFDLVVMDLEMPVMNGKEAVRRIRQYETEQRRIPVKVIIATGNCDLTEYSECMGSDKGIRADFFYRKPLLKKDVEEFVELLQKEKTGEKVCVAVGIDGKAEEDLRGVLKGYRVNLVGVKSVGEAESFMRNWKVEVVWILVGLEEKSEDVDNFVRKMKEMGIEIVTIWKEMDGEKRKWCKEMKIEKTIEMPLRGEEVRRAFGNWI